MDYEKKIRVLLSENEFLQLQMEDLNSEIKKREEEIDLLGDVTESTAALRSKIDSNLIEIEQLRYNSLQVSEKSLGIEMMNEELEMSLYKEIKGRQKDQASLKELNSVKTNMEIVSDELNEAAALYKKIQSLKAELAEAKSNVSMKEIENQDLKMEIEELKELVKILKNNKPD
jgi:DNA repair exonuclease SbcCD ATPase subunit